MPTQRTTNLWREEGPWLVLALLAVALPAFRRGWMGVVLACLFLPQVSQAFSWDHAWERPDQQAMKALEQKDPKKAATLFEQPDWKGIAHYQAGDYEQAEQVFSEMDSPDAQYNQGNALAKLGKYLEAIASYQAALTQQPDHEDARHNLDLLKELLKDQQSESSQGSESESSDSSSEDQQSQEQESGESGKENNPGQAASNNDGQETENNSSEPTQDSASNANQSEKSQSQNSAQDPQDNPDQSDIARSSPGENEEDADSREQLLSSSRSQEARDDQQSEQALQQWLRRIPDDPGGLLRRKFLLEHRRRLEAGTAVESSGRLW